MNAEWHEAILLFALFQHTACHTLVRVSLNS
jgi:hypothetical protein